MKRSWAYPYMVAESDPYWRYTSPWSRSTKPFENSRTERLIKWGIKQTYHLLVYLVNEVKESEWRA